MFKHAGRGAQIPDPADYEETGLGELSKPDGRPAPAISLTGAPPGAAEEHDRAAAGIGEMSASDKSAMLLLIALYTLQGIPIGLAFGTMPYLLKAHMSYADIGIFMLSTYPYSLKLLWSPVVDSLFVGEWRVPGTSFVLSLGKRKSWIVPIQLAIGVMLLFLARHARDMVESPHVYTVTALFFALIFLAATQDIAVDGWALTLLSRPNLGYASTAQTVGINIGYFMSFTVFLALNSVEFGNKYLRSVPRDFPLLSLGAYLQVCGLVFLAFTTWLLLCRREEMHTTPDGEMELVQAYTVMGRIMGLQHVRLIMLVHLIAKFGFQANEAVTGLKLVEHGLGKEDLAFAVLIDFPFQIVFGYLTAMWSRGSRPLRPWVIAFVGRLALALCAMALVYGMPVPPAKISTSYFFLIVLSTVLNSFASTVQFVGINAFHTKVADPVIGGTYMTLLNTMSNLGGTWPRYFVLKMVDYFTVSRCEPPADVSPARLDELLRHANITMGLGECTSEAGKTQCAAVGGHCTVLRDGYYWTNTLCVAVGALSLLLVILPIARSLERVPPQAWRVSLIKPAH